MATQKRVLVWSTPRSLSTVLMRALSQLPDSLIIHEFLLLAGWNEVGLPDCPGDWKANLSDMDTEPGFNIKSWKEMYEQPYPGKSFILGKEICDGMIGRIMEMIPEGYTHVFLMRHPSKSITSLDKALSYFPDDVVRLSMQKPSFKALADIYDYVTTTLGQQAPVVLDAADLLAKPAEALRLLCEATGMPFSQDLFHWDQLIGEPPSNWLMPKMMWSNNKDVGLFNSAFQSTCFHSNQATSGAAKEKDAIKPELQQLIQDALPYYNYLYEHRLIIPD
ncbi:branched-chain-amino-acid aminotransferase-like protein 2 [Patiria miniata]|uniref:Sulfotransferase family protein n=1 Tax=Patiria miniata TaxID=46514 RepID=A0A913Z5M5_PATMI|nr:branched-chain-amino-acid aminotransferase-like protein 2 [Patiria miniata]